MQRLLKALEKGMTLIGCCVLRVVIRLVDGQAQVQLNRKAIQTGGRWHVTVFV